MDRVRASLRQHHRLALLLLALALCIKALIPAGYMLGAHSRVLTIEICADTLGAKVMKRIVVPQHAQPGENADEQGKSAAPCPYGGLGMTGLPGADALLLALALAFILALGFVQARPAPPRPLAHVRPPLRGPPLPA